MRVTVMGAGGVGGYLGAVLARAGHDVVFVARGAHLAALASRGLTLEAAGRRETLDPVRAVADPAAAGHRAELVLFTVKGYDTEAAARALAPTVDPGASILTLQNGVDSVERLETVLGPGRILAGTATIEATVSEPGVVRQGAARPRIVLGEPAGGVSSRAEAVAAALRQPGVEVTVTGDARRAIWEKFVRLAPGASLTAACQATIGQVRATIEGAALYRALVGEAIAVGRAAGIDLGGEALEAALAFIEGLPASMKTSMQRDYERGRRVELEELTGAVVRRGAQLGVPTPVFEIVYGLLKVRALAFGGLGEGPRPEKPGPGGGTA